MSMRKRDTMLRSSRALSLAVFFLLAAVLNLGAQTAPQSQQQPGQQQRITSFRREDIPVSLGILIDNSGSMRNKRPAVNQAALNLVRASNRQDEVFIVNYNDEAYNDQDFTADINL